MEDFKLQKMLKREWISIEKQVDIKEKKILLMIKKGYNDIDIVLNNYYLISELIKLNNTDSDYYIYINIILPYIVKNYLKYIKYTIKPNKIKKKLSSKDFIRLNNSNLNIDNSIDIIVILILKKLIKYNQVIYYYNIKYLISIYNINVYVKEIVNYYLDKFSFLPIDILNNSSSVIENNNIFEYFHISLHEHQKKIYNIFKNNSNKLIFYTAPTSSGKTLTPIGLCEEYKVIFICASRHIGMNLAKSAVNVGRKIGFAFGCKTIDDIRLHFFSVNTYTNDKHKRPIHTDGINVEMLICDLFSYESAMLYMKSFFDIKKIILFWDEPTISMDYDSHPLHEIIELNWRINEIPNIILSSATLPNNLDLLIQNYKKKFEGEFYNIDSIDEHTNITLVNNDGNIIMPHMYLHNKNDINNYLNTLGEKYKKFLSIEQCSKFILNSKLLNEFTDIHSNITTINSKTIKNFYYYILKNEEIVNIPNITFDNSLCFSTTSSININYGPGLYIVENDYKNMIEELVKDININKNALQEVENDINYNLSLSEKLIRLKKDLEDKLKKEEGKENKITDQRFDNETKNIMKKIELIEKKYKSINLDDKYIPNTFSHYSKWNKEKKFKKLDLFKSDIDHEYINKIIELDISFDYKILLLIGIGILTNDNNEYNTVMRELADSKKLLLIIASSDYIYGTNYQFAHCYLSHNIANITQEKIIQAIGRVGRKEKNKRFTFRILNDEHINILFRDNKNMEGDKMNKLMS